MARNYPKTSQIEQEASLQTVGSATNTPLDTVLSKVDVNLQFPFQLYAATIPDSKIYIRGNELAVSDGSTKAINLNKNARNTFSGGWVDFQLQVDNSSQITSSFPASTLGYFRRCAFSVSRIQQITLNYSSEFSSSSNLPDPYTLVSADEELCGYVDLVCTNATGKYKTIGSSTDVIENTKIVNVLESGKELFSSTGNVLIGTRTDNSKLTVEGAVATPSTVISGTTNALTLSNSHNTVFVNANSGVNVTLTFPDASTCPGREYTIKKLTKDTYGYVNLVPNGSDTIEGFTSFKFYYENETYTFKAVGTTWRIK